MRKQTYLNTSGSTQKRLIGSIRDRKLAQSKLNKRNGVSLVIRLTPDSYMLADDEQGNPIETSDRWKAARFSTVFGAGEALKDVGGMARWQDATLEAVTV